MDLHYDIALGYFVTVQGSVSPLKSLTLKRGDDLELRIHFYRNTVATELDGTYSLRFLLKLTPGLDVVMLATNTSWTVDDGVYIGSLNTNGATLSELLANKVTTKVYGEITYTDESGGPKTSRLLNVTVENDLYRGDEVAPDPEETPDDKYLSVTITQTFSDADKGRGRSNIDALDAAGVRSVELAGLSTSSGASVTSADSILSAIGKLQKRSEIPSGLTQPLVRIVSTVDSPEAFLGTASDSSAHAFGFTTRGSGSDSLFVQSNNFETGGYISVTYGDSGELSFNDTSTVRPTVNSFSLYTAGFTPFSNLSGASWLPFKGCAILDLEIDPADSTGPTLADAVINAFYQGFTLKGDAIATGGFISLNGSVVTSSSLTARTYLTGTKSWSIIP